jgi:hypothetical protein
MVLFPLPKLNAIPAGAFSGLDRPACEIAAEVRPERTPYFFEVDFFFDEVFFRGTFPPSFRASDNPIAIACFLLVTFLPDRPLLSVPSFLSCIAFSTFLEAFLPYLAMAFFSFELFWISGYQQTGSVNRTRLVPFPITSRLKWMRCLQPSFPFKVIHMNGSEHSDSCIEMGRVTAIAWTKDVQRKEQAVINEQ